MNHPCRLAPLLFLICTLSISVQAAEQSAATAAAAGTAAPTPHYTDRGADTCIKCHDEDSEFPVFSIFKTKHATRADARTPMAGLQCEACHGPGSEHAKNVPEGQKQGPILAYGRKSRVPAEKQNAMCLGCHEGQARMHWAGSEHARADVGCSDCHRIHAERDAVLAKPEQPAVCQKCHQSVRADFLKPSVHPVRFGVMGCSDCHNTHGSVTDRLLVKPSVNQLCTTCHAEKRGPFLWEHAPVTEDCTTCHTPHGSIHRGLLVKRPPLLCQQCHSQAGHPSDAYTATGLPGGAPSGFLLGQSCLNCHSQVHGSNHPSGVKLMR
jgi:DmsE family decaheme c-type cytochrome